MIEKILLDKQIFSSNPYIRGENNWANRNLDVNGGHRKHRTKHKRRTNDIRRINERR